jgi:hypothetical protein
MRRGSGAGERVNTLSGSRCFDLIGGRSRQPVSSDNLDEHDNRNRYLRGEKQEVDDEVARLNEMSRIKGWVPGAGFPELSSRTSHTDG